ncbi:hypothetical protein HOLleu_28781 [Holothuria leucospilota]|uniref:Uncharacterized protein n=1 Tax=Holothuria leucospilota TaxID=206669 RepID=A0A9Q1BMI1_HOLLE|nr:hypothetical protein HOLleu_28781 [Holothuria leucospilota]
MAFRVLFYSAVFLRLSLSAEALKCYTYYSCQGGDLCGGSSITTDLEETTCLSDLHDACLSLRLGYTVNGERIESTLLGCSTDVGLRPGCFNIHELPSSLASGYQDIGYDTFEYCLCDQDLCNDDINFVSNNNGNGNSNNGNNNAGSLICNSEFSCTGASCGNFGLFANTGLQQTTCQSGIHDVCLAVKWTYTVNGQRTESTVSGCGVDYGLGTGCFNYHNLPTSAIQDYQGISYDTFEYCICDQDRCNDDTIFINGSTPTTFTLPAIVGALLVSLGTILGKI